MRASVRFHSLRDTCLTFMAIRGDDPLRIQWRAGHTSFAMTEKYIAQARRFEAGFGNPFEPLSSLLASVRNAVARIGPPTGPLCPPDTT